VGGPAKAFSQKEGGKNLLDTRPEKGQALGEEGWIRGKSLRGELAHRVKADEWWVQRGQKSQDPCRKSRDGTALW